MKDKTLLILAAGMGSRFGGLKQIEPIGPNGEFIIDYSIYDAKKSGFNKVVFIIKEENYNVFKETIGARIEDKINVEYVFQKMNTTPEGIDYKDRIKPWGTAHAIMAAKSVINEPFIIINADDFYGKDAFMKAAEFLDNSENENEYGLIGYLTGNTLSENGAVKRGICEQEDGYLKEIIESNVETINNKIIAKPLEYEDEFEVKNDTLVSMNMMCFKPGLFKLLDNDIITFFQKNKDNLDKCEFLIPSVIGENIQNNKIKVKVLKTDAIWYGITYPEDKEPVKESINNLINNLEYPNNLWS